MIQPQAAEVDKTSFLQPLFPLIIPSNSARQGCFHGCSVSNRLWVVPSHALRMTGTDVGVIQVGFGNGERLSEMMLFFLLHFEVWSASFPKAGQKWWENYLGGLLLEWPLRYSVIWVFGVKYLKPEGFPYSDSKLWLKHMSRIQRCIQEVLLILCILLHAVVPIFWTRACCVGVR